MKIIGTSDLVKVTSAHDMNSIVNYNMKTQKTEGQWRNQGQHLTQSDLVGFYGTANHPGLSLHQEGLYFARQAYNNAKLSNLHQLRPNHHLDFNTLPNRLSICHTIVQSFDYQANPQLKPKQVHRMGQQLIIGIQTYMKKYYHYQINACMISTHIDDDHDQIRNGKLHQTHLHNHIIICSYNDQGKSISAFLRKPDLYTFQKINDAVDAMNNLHDYYFLKLKREVEPSSTFTKTNNYKQKSLSNIQKAIVRFSKINDKAFDKYPNNFKKAKAYRNHELVIKFHYKTRIKKDTRTHKPRKQFTMQDLITKKNQRIQWYNLTNLRLLVWKRKEDEKCERAIKQLNITQIKNKSITKNQYNKMLKNSLEQLPPLNELSSNQQRQQHQIYLNDASIPPNHKQQITPTVNFENYLHKLVQDAQWKNTGDIGRQNNIKVLILGQNINQIEQKRLHKQPINSNNNQELHRQIQRNQHGLQQH